VLEREANSSTDNPLVFADTGEMISGGNFHGQPVALALDFAAIASPSWPTSASAASSSWSTRTCRAACRRSCPRLRPQLRLHDRPGQRRRAGVSENKVLCHPASVDSIPSSAGREDHVSMGAHAALKLAQVHDQVRTVLAIELLCAAQGLDLRRPLRSTAILEAVHAAIRATVPAMMVDRPLAPRHRRRPRAHRRWHPARRGQGRRRSPVRLP
jgi:histidine ammonia-lyase